VAVHDRHDFRRFRDLDRRDVGRWSRKL